MLSSLIINNHKFVLAEEELNMPSAFNRYLREYLLKINYFISTEFNRAWPLKVNYFSIMKFYPYATFSKLMFF